jgi:excisionase family DNA binding protein
MTTPKQNQAKNQRRQPQSETTPHSITGPAPEVMTAEEAATYLSLAPSTIYQKVSERSIPFTKIRNLLRFRKADLDAWLQQQTIYPVRDIYDEFVRWHSRHLFSECLKSRGKQPQEISQKELTKLAQSALQDLLNDENNQLQEPS